ncbi:hypothetical protein KCU91_g15922, partial [Aureobasidium melanogenum]
MDVDLTNAPRTSWIKAEKRAKEEKRNRIAKKQKRKVTNQMTFKKNPRTGKKGGQKEKSEESIRVRPYRRSPTEFWKG